VNSRIRTYTRALPVLSLLLAAAPAAARPVSSSGAAPGLGARSLSVWGVLDPGPIDGVGVGGRLTLPLVPQGVLHAPSVRDEFTLELGADFLHYRDRIGFAPYDVDYSWNGFLLVGGATWNFWLTPRFALYPKLDLGWWFGWYRGWDTQYGYGRANFDGLFLQGAAGLIYRLQTVTFRLELGSGLVRIGVGFPL